MDSNIQARLQLFQTLLVPVTVLKLESPRLDRHALRFERQKRPSDRGIQVRTITNKILPYLIFNVAETDHHRGLGALIVERFAAEGANIAINYVSSLDRAKQTAVKIETAYQAKTVLIQGVCILLKSFLAASISS